MAASTIPIFVEALQVGAATISTANANRDGTGTIATVVTAGADGSRVDRVDIVATGTTTAGVVRLWYHDGSNYFLFKEILVTAITPSTSVAVWSYELVREDGQAVLELPSGSSLRASTHNAETFKVIAQGGSY